MVVVMVRRDEELREDVEGTVPSGDVDALYGDTVDGDARLDSA